MIIVPAFQTEAEEADWWFANQDLIAEELQRTKPPLARSAALRRLAAIRGVSVEELWANAHADAARAEKADLPRSA